MAKNTKIFLNDIKNYDLIRDMIRHIYMYGNYSKGDIVKNNIVGSERSVYDMLKRIENYLHGEYLEIHNLPNRKKDKRGYRFKYDPFQCPINFLADSYKNCSYVVEDFIFYFTLLQAFKPYSKFNPYKKHKIADYSEDVSELNIVDEFDYDTLIASLHDVLMANEDILQFHGQSDVAKQSDTETLITRAKARDRLNELVELGIILKKNNLYSLAPDIFEGFEEELDSLLLMVQFFYNITDLCIPGYYLSTTLMQYAMTIDSDNIISMNCEQLNPVFFYKNCSIQNVIDDNIFWFILCAIDQQSPITFKYKNKVGAINEYEVFPIKVVIERQYGRHYVYAYNYAYQKYMLQRLDSISSVKKSNKTPYDNVFCFLENPNDNIKEQLNKLYTKDMTNVWNTTTSHELTKVVIHFSFQPEEYTKIYNRVTATGRNGIIQDIDDHSFDYIVSVQSPLEMKPWIRNFGSYAVVDKETCPELYKEIKNDYRKALKSYGII